MPKYSLKVEKHADGLTFHIAGRDLAHANADLLNDCMGKLMACAEQNDCFTKGLNVNCLTTLTDHHKQTQCISKAFGFAR